MNDKRNEHRYDNRNDKVTDSGALKQNDTLKTSDPETHVDEQEGDGIRVQGEKLEEKFNPPAKPVGVLKGKDAAAVKKAEAKASKE